MTEPKLFSSRAGISVVGGGMLSSASWPLGKVTLDAEALTVDTFFKSYRICISDIDCVSQQIFMVNVFHHACDVPKLVQMSGFRLFSRLRDAIKQHHLKIEVRE